VQSNNVGWGRMQKIFPGKLTNIKLVPKADASTLEVEASALGTNLIFVSIVCFYNLHR